jgi:hypothetical protein
VADSASESHTNTVSKCAVSLADDSTTTTFAASVRDCSRSMSVSTPDADASISHVACAPTRGVGAIVNTPSRSK